MRCEGALALGDKGLAFACARGWRLGRRQARGLDLGVALAVREALDDEVVVQKRDAARSFGALEAVRVVWGKSGQRAQEKGHSGGCSHRPPPPLSSPTRLTQGPSIGSPHFWSVHNDPLSSW
mgnify:CR=1 FL=1